MSKDSAKTKAELLAELKKQRKQIKDLRSLNSENQLLAQALKESEKKYSTLVENSQDGIIIIQDGLLKFVNQMSIKYMGYTPNELLETDFMKLVAPVCRPAIKKRYEDRMAGKNIPNVYETKLISKTGEILPIEINSVLIEYEGRSADLVFTRDILERLKVREQLQKAHDDLERRVLERTKELNKINKKLKSEIKDRVKAEEELRLWYNKLKSVLDETVQAIAAIVDSKDPYTAGHQRRVALLAVEIAKEMKLPQEQIEAVRVSATVHDIGKIHVPAEILSKPGQLHKIEFDLVKFHSQIGHNILKEIRFPWPVADIVHQHHELYDGTGYPQGLKGDDIKLEARIICVADVIEAMSSHRPYRASLGINAAVKEVKKYSGKRYDKQVVKACLKVIESGLFS